MHIHVKYNSEALHLRALLKVTLYLKYCHIPKLMVTAFQWPKLEIIYYEFSQQNQ